MVAKGREGETKMKGRLLIIFLRFPNSWFPRWYRSIITFPLDYIFLSGKTADAAKRKKERKTMIRLEKIKKMDSISCEKKRHLIPFGKNRGQAQTILPLFGELGKQLTLTEENLPLRLIFGGGRGERAKNCNPATFPLSRKNSFRSWLAVPTAFGLGWEITSLASFSLYLVCVGIRVGCRRVQKSDFPSFPVFS